MSRLPMGQGVSARRVRTECERGSQTELDLSDIAAKRAELREKRAGELDAMCGAWFSAAIDAWGKADAYADEIGVTKSILSEMRSGKRVVRMRDCLPLLENRESAMVLINALCEAAGLAPAKPRRKVTRSQVEAKALDTIRKFELWKLVRGEIAAELGTDCDDVEAAVVGDVAEAAK